MPATLSFSDVSAASDGAEALILVGRVDALRGDSVRALVPGDVAAAWDRMLDSLTVGDAGSSTSSWSSGDGAARIAVCALPDAGSRHNSPSRPHSITSLVRKASGLEDRVAVILVVDSPDHVEAAGAAVARAFPQFDGKGASPSSERSIRIAFVGPDETTIDRDRLSVLASSIRFAARLVDTPPAVLNTDAFVAEARAVAVEVGADIDVIDGDQLTERGFGGLVGVGKAAVHGPALVVLSWRPEVSRRTLAWVGKGIVYDTGGLSIKGKDHMPGMKIDMGGAAAVLGAFRAAALTHTRDTVYGILCLAENSVGPEATRPDDILSMYSGKTVEVNNTDAEGRLVLGDGVAYVSQNLTPDVIVDLATLTGAQLMATGKKHASIVCNDPDLETQAVVAGQQSGDLVWPLPYAPELFRAEFRSEVADMKNSVKDRMNAQSSCAAQFVAEHLDPDWEGSWLHVDMAGPVEAEDRGTGYGVALLCELFDIGR